MFDIGFGEMGLLLIVGLIVLGPERLPRYAAQAGKFMRQFRDQVAQARSTITDAADIDPSLLRDLQDLDPRRMLDGDTAPKPAPKKTDYVPLDPDTT